MLESMHVVETLDKLKKALKGGDVGYSLSNEAIEWNKSVRDAADSDELLRVLESVKGKVGERLDETGLLIDKEQHECESMRTKYGSKWTQGYSSGINSNMCKELTKNRDAFTKGSGSDTQLMSRFSSSKRVTDILRQPLDNVEVIFAAEVSGDKDTGAAVLLIDDDSGGGFNDIGEQVFKIFSNVKVHVDKLQALVQRIRLLKKERAEVVQDLKQKV
jgi:hypothetical protein